MTLPNIHAVLDANGFACAVGNAQLLIECAPIETAEYAVYTVVNTGMGPESLPVDRGFSYGDALHYARRQCQSSRVRTVTVTYATPALIPA